MVFIALMSLLLVSGGMCVYGHSLICISCVIAFRASAVLRNETAVDAVELFDRASLRECERDEDMARLVPDILGADPMAAALLIECRGSDPDALKVTCLTGWGLRGVEALQCPVKSNLPIGL